MKLLLVVKYFMSTDGKLAVFGKCIVDLATKQSITGTTYGKIWLKLILANYLLI